MFIIIEQFIGTIVYWMKDISLKTLGQRLLTTHPVNHTPLLVRPHCKIRDNKHEIISGNISYTCICTCILQNLMLFTVYLTP